jgi:hypothetical protein
MKIKQAFTVIFSLSIVISTSTVSVAETTYRGHGHLESRTTTTTTTSSSATTVKKPTVKVKVKKKYVTVVVTKKNVVTNSSNNSTNTELSHAGSSRRQ